MRSYLCGVAYRVGPAADIEGLFSEASKDGGTGIEFFRARGLRQYRAQAESTAAMCGVVVRECLRKAALSGVQIGAVIVDVDNWHCTPEDRVQMFESLHAAGIGRVPIVGLSLQTCSGCMAAIQIADRLVRTDPDGRPVLILLCGRAAPGGSRIDLRRATILSDGVSACVVSGKPGSFAVLACTSQTNLEMVRTGTVGEKAAISLVRGYGDIAAVAKGLYGQTGVSPAEINGLFVTNGNLMYGSFAARAAGVSTERTYSDNIGVFGHVFSCDHLINIVTYGETKTFSQGEKYMLIGWSPYVFSGAILSYVGECA